MKKFVKLSCLNAPPPYSHKGFQDLGNKKRKAFTLTEALIAIAIIGIIAALFMGNLNNGKVKQRELLGKFDIIFSKLNDLTQMTAAMSKNYSNWSADIGSLKNLSCTTSDNKSQCLKTALMSQSSQITDISDPAGAFKNYDKLKLQLLAIFPNLDTDNMVAFKLNGSAYVLAAYIDSSCSTDIPVYQNTAGEIEYVKGCGFLLTDVNGKEKPNNLLVNEDKTIDQFLMAITKDGLVKSNYLNGLAQCPDGTRWNAEQGACVAAAECPYNMEEMQAREQANDNDLIVKEIYNEDVECYQIRCKSGDKFDSENKCPTDCPAGEKRLGGLWYSEGGDLPDKWAEKACCVPVENQTDLDNIRNDLNKNYCLTADIDFDRAGAGSTEENGWTPISNLQGNFYGNGHRIKGIYMNQKCSALFGNELSGAVENLEVNGSGNEDEADMIQQEDVAIAYRPTETSKIQNVVNSANFAGRCSSGIVGSGSSTITNAINLGNFNGHDSGGIIYNGSHTITNAINLGNFNSGSSAGISNLGSTSKLTNAINLGNFNDAASAGIGYFGLKNITNVINLGNFNSESSAGISYNDDTTITNAINLGNFNGRASGGIFKYCPNASAPSPKIITNAINLGNFNGDSSGGINFNPYNNNSDNSTRITNAINLGNFNNTNGSGISYKGNPQIFKAYHLAPNSTELPIFALASLYNTFYLTNSISGCMVTVNFNGCTEIFEEDVKKAATYSAIANDTENAKYWSIIDGYYPTLKASVMPPQIFRDCRNDENPYGGCYDVLNTPNAFMPDFQQNNINTIIATEENKPYIMWAWKIPNPKVEAPVLRWQCKPYRVDGYDCCKPSYATWEKKLQSCPAINSANYPNYRAIN